MRRPPDYGAGDGVDAKTEMPAIWGEGGRAGRAVHAAHELLLGWDDVGIVYPKERMRVSSRAAV